MKKSIVKTAVAVSAVSLFLSACGGNANPTTNSGTNTPKNNNTSTSTPATTQEETPFKLSLMLPSYSPEQMPESSSVLKLLEEKTNTDLSVTWVPSTTYADKLSATVASGELPQALVALTPKASYIVNAVRSGMFWEIGPYLQDYPNLRRMSNIVLNNISIDGKVYGIYRERDLARFGLMMRQDWLDNLQLEEPTNLDELYNVLKEFTYSDPDKNGKDDTIGLAVGMQGSVIAGFKDILVYHGGPNEWEVQDGQLIPAHMTDAYMDTMLFYKKLYDENIINQDFAVVQDGRAVINKGTAGVWIDNMVDGKGIQDNIQKITAEAKITLVNRIAGPAGDRTRAGNGYLGMFMIPKTSVKTEDELKRILTYLDRVSEEDIQNLMKYGVEGSHYTVDGGNYSANEDAKVRAELNDSNQFMVLQDKVVSYGTELEKLAVDKFNDNVEIAIPNPAAGFISETEIEKGTEISKIIADATVKFIMGSIDEEQWDKEVEKWLQSGGSKIMEEFNAEYAKLAQ